MNGLRGADAGGAAGATGVAGAGGAGVGAGGATGALASGAGASAAGGSGAGAAGAASGSAGGRSLNSALARSSRDRAGAFGSFSWRVRARSSSRAASSARSASAWASTSATSAAVRRRLTGLTSTGASASASAAFFVVALRRVFLAGASSCFLRLSRSQRTRAAATVSSVRAEPAARARTPMSRSMPRTWSGATPNSSARSCTFVLTTQSSVTA